MAKTQKNIPIVSSVQQGTKPGYKRKGYIVNMIKADKIDAIAFWDRIDIKDVVEEAFTDYINKYEKKNGEIKIPKKK